MRRVDPEADAPFRAALDDGASPFESGSTVPRGYEPAEEDRAAVIRSLIRVDDDQ